MKSIIEPKIENFLSWNRDHLKSKNIFKVDEKKFQKIKVLFALAIRINN